MATTGTISSLGVGSGIDLNSVVSKLMAVEQAPLKNLDTKEVSYQAKLTAFGTLKGSFAALQTAVDALKSPLLFKNMTATSSATSVLTASANTAATAGTYSLNVLARAQGQTIASTQQFNSMSSNIATANGKLKIELGTTTTANGVTTFTPDGTKTAVTIDISQSNSSLGSIRDAINNANAGVSARIVDVGSGAYKLVVSSTDIGANKSFQITALDSTGTTQLINNTGLAQFSYIPSATAGAGNEYSRTVTAQDAHIKVDGLDIYRSTNTISDAITGVTMSLVADSGTSTLTVGKNTTGVSTAVQNFVTAYNTAADQIRTLSAYNTQTKKASVLTGDAGARGLQSALSQMASLSLTTESSDVRTLTDIGITVGRDGKLAFNSAKLGSALTSSPSAVAELITDGYGGTSGIASRMSSLLNTVVMDSKTGILATSTDNVNRTITMIGNQRASLQTRLSHVLANYQAQFSSMDTFVSNWTRTGSYLTQQLSALTGASGK